MNIFSSIPKEPEDPIYGLQVTFKKDERKDKINLSIGVFPGHQGSSFRFNAVDSAEDILLEKLYPKDYLPIDGLPAFNEKVADLVLGEDRKEMTLSSYTAQTIGGTAALHIGAKFLLQHCTQKIYIPDPTWVNHRRLFEACGLEVISYPYEITAAGGVNIQRILTAIQSMPEGAAIVFQASCHNPTGIDPTDAEWQVLSQAIKKRKLITFFDMAYQGLGRGLHEDAFSIRLFLEEDHEMLIATSFSKNFGLYSERTGALTITCTRESVIPISSQVRKIIRSIYSSPASHGAQIVQTILNDPTLTANWQRELKHLRETLTTSRQALYNALSKKQPHKNFTALQKSIGLFALTFLPTEKVHSLRQEHGLYLCDDSRINIAAIRQELIETIANALLSP
ncbi:MAG: aspC [Chlamydiia bacterium]|nr:aspC [Chlamydiia bacterium]